jgi:pimeloyl-ACP methyl ester carboxylesterase
MPFVENRGAELYWDEQRSGEPLLLIMGLSYPSYMWHCGRPDLTGRYRIIALDDRGVGQSDVSPGIYFIALMASDAASILHVAGVDIVHVFGVFMGGMTAQIRAPTLVIHGETDRLIPPAKSLLIAERIPGAKLVLIPHAGHIFEAERPSAAHRAILEFLDDQPARAQRSSA